MLYTVLINYNSFFRNKRCSKSNYSVKHFSSQAGVYGTLSVQRQTSVHNSLLNAGALE